MTYYLYLGIPIASIVCALIASSIYLNYKKIDCFHIQTKNEQLYEYYNSLSDDEQREIDAKIKEKFILKLFHRDN